MKRALPPSIAAQIKQARVQVDDSKPKRRRGSMNGLEQRYAERLGRRLASGEIKSWGFERVKLRLADGAWFVPDFDVTLADGSLEFHETKGFMREAAALRLKVAADRFPMAFFVVRRVEAGWALKRVGT